MEDAKRLLAEAKRRLSAANEGIRGLRLLGFSEKNATAPQTLVGGFRSRIDDSVQPYGIVLPAGFSETNSLQRMDVWLHGRGDTKTEIPFLIERMNKIGQYAPDGVVVLHPFGRHCNAFKFAGETDVYEAIEHASANMAIDSHRISIRGFSMGGAGCWHLAVHDPSRWFAANPGAGFVDTLVYQGWNDNPPFPLDATQRKLLRWYDVLPWVQNLRNTQTIAYSGEVDKQKRAADRVVQRASELGFDFPYVIGAEMGHKIDETSKRRIDDQLAKWQAEASTAPPTEIDFVTYTLRYSKSDWVQITGMQEHWEAASVKATLSDPNDITI
ncbi:MAG: prolyl oligopeptidase family serine peptidase, partial [Planctomycetota bacterium]